MADGKKAKAKKVCGAKTKAGGKCQRRAGAGTDHIGHGHCSLHLGSTPSGKKAAAREAAREYAAELELLVGDGIPIEPHDALLMCIRMTAAEVHFFTEQIMGLQLTDVVVRPKKQGTVTLGHNSGSVVEEFEQQEQLNLWIQERKLAMERLARFSKMALDAGVAERQVQIAERFGDAIARLIDGIFGDLKLTPQQRKNAPLIVRRHLELMQGGVS